MGYDVHITRKQEWSAEDGPEITLEEWKEYIKSDPEMRIDGFSQTTNPKTGEILRYENTGLAAWTAYSRSPRTPWFDYRRGRIVVRNPDPEILAKMCRVAEALSAKVQGDDGEIYDPSGKIVG